MVPFFAVALLATNLNAAPVAVLPLRAYLLRQETLDATVSGVPGTYLFDTGEGVTAISSDVASRIGCRPWGRITGFRMTGERGGNPHCDNVAFTAAGLKFNVPSAIALDIMKFIGPGVPKVDGAIGLDAFAGRTITIIPRSCIIVESKQSLVARIAGTKALPVRLVRDAEGVSLTVDAAVPTRDGMAWFELDSGDGGDFVVANYIAPLIGLPEDLSTARYFTFKLANGIAVSGPVRTRDLILDGDIGARFLNNWDLTLDLARGAAWLSPKSTCPASR
jgi:hypothetical protein